MIAQPAPSLREVQRWIKARIAPARDPAAPADAAGAQVALAPQRGTPGVERLRVYADAYRARIFDALAEAYPAVKQVVGAGAFFELASAYAAAHPSHDYNLSFSGRALPAFLAAAPLTQRLPFLPDLATLEWRVVEAFHAFDVPPVEPAGFAALAAEALERARLIFHPSVAVVRSAWPICDLWAARAQPRETIDINIDGRPQAVVVSRQGLDVSCAVVPPAEAAFLERLLSGMPLGEACASLSGEPEVTAAMVTRWTGAWMRHRLITRLEAPGA